MKMLPFLMHEYCSLTALSLTMPPKLMKAHQNLDRAVMKLYGFSKDTTEAEIVAELMKRYQELVEGKNG